MIKINPDRTASPQNPNQLQYSLTGTAVAIELQRAPTNTTSLSQTDSR
jgi:hypothetical protein